MAFTVSSEVLYKDLLVAYMCAREHKGNKQYVADFDLHLERNLKNLCRDLLSRSYKPLPSTCFVVTHPKKREIFAAAFRDRVVHHLLFNYIHVLLERSFIYDSYSCIKNRGTHFGIERLYSHIRACSNNYSRKVWILKMDIKGYFMHIDRSLLCRITEDSIISMCTHKVNSAQGTRFKDTIDLDLVLYLVKEIVMLDPTDNCHMNGRRRDWFGLPDSKSLFKSQNGCGLPIGNLTSQLFSNVYLNKLDQFIKRELHCNHYGRYVDDFFIVHEDKMFLKSLVPKIEVFLENSLHLQVNKGKTRICSSTYGVDFLGGFLKPYRVYVSSQSFRRMNQQLDSLSRKTYEDRFYSINSFLGSLAHYKSFKVRKRLVESLHPLFSRFATIDADFHKLKRVPWVVWASKIQKATGLSLA